MRDASGNDMVSPVPGRADSLQTQPPRYPKSGFISVQLTSTGSGALDVLPSGDSVPRLTLMGSGQLLFGPGNAARDTILERKTPSVLGLGADDSFMTGKNTTANRPSASSVGEGAMIYDTTLDQPIWSNGTNWKDASGTVV